MFIKIMLPLLKPKTLWSTYKNYNNVSNISKYEKIMWRVKSK